MRISTACRLAPEGAPDEEIVEEVLAGTPACFDLLVRRHEKRLRRAVRGVLRDRSEVEDVVQQAFVQAYAGLDRFAGQAAFATWLTRIAVNEALMRARRSRQVERAVIALALWAEEHGRNPEQEAGTREAMARVREALPLLRARHREVLQLAVVHGLTSAEIADRLGVREGAAKVRLHRARQALRARIDGGPAPARSAPGLPPRLALAPEPARLNGTAPRSARQRG